MTILSASSCSWCCCTQSHALAIAQKCALWSKSFSGVFVWVSGAGGHSIAVGQGVDSVDTVSSDWRCHMQVHTVVFFRN